MKSRRFIVAAFFLAVVSAASLMMLLFVMRIRPFTNDDAYVYYNYARNFVLGRPFAYDTRNIPSEGFTSMLFLLLLVPFEALRVNMTFASAVINITAVMGIAALSAWIACQAGLLKRDTAALYALLCLALLTTDSNIIGMIEWGLETMLGPLTILAAAAFLSIACQPQRHPRIRSRAVTGFYATVFLCYLVRPENMVFVLGVGGLVLLQGYANRRETAIKGLAFAGVLAAYHLWKLAVFGDVLPTGFYRKVSAGAGSAYVWEGIHAYHRQLLVLAVAALLIGGAAVFKRRWTLLRQQWLWLLVGVSATTLIFFTQTRPLIGYNHRFLVNPIVFGYVIAALLVLWGLEWAMEAIGRLTKRDRAVELGKWLVIGLVVGAGLLRIEAAPSTWSLAGLNLYRRSVSETEKHQYLRIGGFLRERLPQHKNITLVFGDAGAIPYAFDGRFIDFNGLTEPAIAHLFQEPDGPEKTRQFTNYILRQRPDIIVLAFGPVREGVWLTPVNRHSPFRGPLPLGMYVGFKEFGIAYACTIRAYYDLHIGVWQGSPYAKAITRAVRDYCAESGYTLEHGLTIASPDNRRVVFPLAP